ncbi:MAG TPA: ester cyclase [Candidatus Limnocylindrales bacterium]|nr:ester cyclase [Candidatus Limnocylindrales bacterium]
MTHNSSSEEARERLNWPITPDLYEQIRQLWLKHSMAKDKCDVDRLIETLTPTCVYEVVPTGQRWHGHDGARAFYTSLIGAFPDVSFTLQHIVIGPQGVFEAAQLTATHQGVWAGIAPTGRAIRLSLMLYFPWDRELALFDGERVFFDRGEMDELLLC